MRSQCTKSSREGRYSRHYMGNHFCGCPLTTLLYFTFGIGKFRMHYQGDSSYIFLFQLNSIFLFFSEITFWFFWSLLLLKIVVANILGWLKEQMGICVNIKNKLCSFVCQAKITRVINHCVSKHKVITSQN